MKKRLVLAVATVMMLGAVIPSRVYAKTIDNGTDIFTVSTSNSFDEKQALTYARVVCLKHSGSGNGTLLATCDQHVWVNGEQVWPIYRSTDSGESWSHITDVKDETFGTNRKAQPMLYELPQSVGNLPAGTLLLAGNLVPDDQSSSRIVLYSSTDQGNTWDYLSTVDVGGPFDYDNSASSTTTTIWEPYLYVDDYGHLICAYSDERQKSKGALQTLSLKYSSDGLNWSSESNIVAIKNQNDRPGMVTVSKMGNGKYIATYEVVNKPSYTQNSSPVYCKFSSDGLNWDEDDLGTLLQTADGQSLGSSPYVKWVDAGGPNGMVVVGAKWVVNANGDIQEGGQNLFVNYNYGEGNWERYPNAITWNGEDIDYLDAFSQCLETNADNSQIYQIANLGHSASDTCTLTIGTLPTTMGIYEAENATLNNATIVSCEDSMGKKEVGYINYSNSSVTFDKIVAPKKGSYTVFVRYNNGSGSASSHTVVINGVNVGTVSYPTTPDWHQYYWTSFTCSLNKGVNSIKLGYKSGYAEIDCIALQKSGYDLSSDFMIENRNSNKYLEVAEMSTENGKVLTQYDKTNYPCQIWNISKMTDGTYQLINKNSGLAAGVKNNSISDGAAIVQETPESDDSQKWSFNCADSGFYYLVNKASGKYMEVTNNLTDNGAAIGQWGPTAYNCQQWAIIKEGIR